MAKAKLYVEWVPCVSAYRLYDPKYPEQTVAYIDTLEEVERSEADHPEYDFVLV